MKHILHSEEVKTKAKELRNQGLSFKTIGETLGIHRNVINYWCKSEEEKELQRKCKREYHDKWYNNLENKELKKDYAKVRRDENWEHVIAIQRKSKEKRRDKVRTAEKLRKKNDPFYRLICQQRGYIKKALNGCGVKKMGKTNELRGCTDEEFKKHIESQFTEGMTWENRGTFGWHIDHIQPLNVFDMKDPEQQRIAFNYNNLRPLWWKDNLSRSKGIRFDQTKYLKDN